MRRFDATRIKDRRKKLGLTQAELAKKVGISREHLIEVEKGRVNPRASLLTRLALALGVKEDYFFCQ